MGRKRLRSRKKPYPHQDDILEAVILVALVRPYLHPESFVEEVRKQLELRGFYAGLVTAKRVWACYANLVKRGRIPDVLNVAVSRADEALEGSDEVPS